MVKRWWAALLLGGALLAAGGCSDDDADRMDVAAGPDTAGGDEDGSNGGDTAGSDDTASGADTASGGDDVASTGDDVASGGDGGGGEDAATGADGGGGDAAGGDGGDASVVTNAVTAANGTLADLSTIVAVPEVVSVGVGWLVIHEDDGGAPGPVIGHQPVSAGRTADLSVTLDRPAEDGETLHAMLHVDEGEPGVYEFPGVDAPARDAQGAIAMAPFVVTVPAGVPAVRFTLGATVDFADYVFEDVAPAGFEEATIGNVERDPALTLRTGWRYEVVNTDADLHPFELLTAGPSAGEDVVLASQVGAGDGWEEDAGVAWSDEDGTLQFTVTDTLAAELDGYRCGFHPTTMRGSVVVE